MMGLQKCPPSKRPRRLARPRTPPFHGDNTGSNPVGDAKHRITHTSDDSSGDDSVFALLLFAVGFDILRSLMTWIKTVPLSEASEDLLRALESQRPLYPKEYATPVFDNEDDMAGIVGSHSLLPSALFHAFSAFGSLMSPDLPLSRQQHEMIATMVSVTNRCFY